MTKNTTSILGILASMILAGAIALAAGYQGLQFAGGPLLLLFALLAFVVQWLAFIPAFSFQTEKYFDLLGSATYILLALAAMYFSNRDPGSLLIGMLVIIWALRLGSFLFIRVSRAGHDSRFRSIKPDFLQFLMTWTIQGLWVFLTFSAGLAAMTSGQPHALDGYVIAGGIMWTAGMLIEVIADQQKTAFRNDPANADKFIQHGLWAWSRHPNYFGEILLWTGIAVIAFPALAGWQYVTLISPLFVLVLLTKVSGVRMLENKARRKWGEDAEYLAYVERTPRLVLNPWGVGS